MQLSFQRKIIAIIALASAVCTVVAILVSSQKIRREGTDDLRAKSEAILSRLEAARDFVAEQGGLDEIIASTVKKNPTGQLSQVDKENILKRVPIYASMVIGSAAADKEHYKFRVFSDEPRNKDNLATSSELEIFKRFQNDPKLAQIVEENDNQLVVYRPVRLSEKQGCLSCHGDPKNSPWGNGKDILGHPMENWSDNKFHGVFAVVSDLAPVRAAALEGTLSIAGWAGGLALLVLLLAIYLLRGPMAVLNEIVGRLKVSGEALANSATEVSNASQSLSSSTSEAAASLEETTASTEEISSMIRMSAQNAEEAQNLSAICEKGARAGKEDVDQLIESMNKISGSSKKMEEIITVIDDVAFQTNLLALNAAVEAARAGEQGKGFAVVAEAVRALAQRSAASAKEISDMIKTSVEQIQEGTKVAEKSGHSLSQMVASIEKVSSLNTQVSQASKEQAQGVENINKAINELDKVTQQNAAASEAAAASSEHLGAQSGQIHELVIELNNLLDGH